MIFALLFMLPACNTRIEGCLDANAGNFNLNAELPCDGCCTYPFLRLTLSQKWGEENFSNADTLADREGQPYQIEDLRYYLTTWSWTNAEGDVFTVDSATNECGDITLKYTPDNLIIDTRKFVYTLGTIRLFPTTDRVRFSLGLTMDFSCLDPEDPDVPPDLTDESPLWNPSTASLESVRLIIKRDLASVTFDTLFMDLSSDLAFNYDTTFEKGADAQWLFTIDYARLFGDADIDDLNSFKTSFQTHFGESIFPTP